MPTPPRPTPTLAALLCLALAILAAGLPPPPGRAAEPADFALRQIGLVTGGASPFAVEGSLLALVNLQALRFYDIAEPAAPRLLSTIAMPNFVDSLQLQGDLAYVSWLGAGFDVYDLASPTAPLLLSRTQLPAPLLNLTVLGDTAYASGSSAPASYRIDLRDPMAPTFHQLRSAPFAGDHRLLGVVERADLGGRHLGYVARDDGSGQWRIHVVDMAGGQLLSTLSSPIWLDSAELDLADGRRMLYYTREDVGVFPVDITDPARPREHDPIGLVEAELLTPGAGVLYVSTKYEYERPERLYTLDLADPASPALAGPLPGRAPRHMTTSGSLLVGIRGAEALALYDIGGQTAPRPLGEIIYGAYVRAFANEHLFAFNEREGLVAIDIRRPAAPRHRPTGVGAGEFGGRAMAAASDQLLLGTNQAGWRLLDVADPASPRLLSRIPVAAGVYPAVAAREAGTSAAYLVTSCQGLFGCAGPRELRVYDLADSASPRERGVVGFPAADGNAHPTSIAAAGGYAYVTFSYTSSFDGMLYVVDARGPAAPRIVAELPIAGSSEDVTLDGDRLYVAAWNGGLHAFSLADPASPRLLSTYRSGATTQAFKVVADGPVVRFVTSSYRSLLYTLDYSDPAAPHLVGQLSAPDAAEELLLADGRVVSSGRAIMIFQRGSAAAGTVRDARGAPIPDVTLQLSGAGGLGISAAMPSAQATDIGGGVLVERSAGGSIAPTFRGAAFAPASRPLSDRALDFVMLGAPATAAASPATATTLAFTDTQGLSSSLRIPAGALSAPSALTLRPQLPGDTGALRFAGQSFALSLAETGARLVQPAELTLRYSRADVRLISDLGQLALYRRGPAGWQPAEAACLGSPAPSHNQAARELRVPICAAGEYALLGPTVRLSLPLLGR